MKKVIAMPLYTHLELDLFFENGHPFRERLRAKVDDADVEERYITLGVGEYATHIKQPNATKRKVLVITEILLWIMMKDPKKQEDHRNEMQSLYIQGKLNEYIKEQGFNVPCNNSDEIERFLNFLSVEIPWIWDYFMVIEIPEVTHQE